MEPVQETSPVPSAMVVVDRLPGREVAWELTPLAPHSDDIEHGVNDKADGPVTPVTADQLGKMALDQDPLSVRQAARCCAFMLAGTHELTPHQLSDDYSGALCQTGSLARWDTKLLGRNGRAGALARGPG